MAAQDQERPAAVTQNQDSNNAGLLSNSTLAVEEQSATPHQEREALSDVTKEEDKSSLPAGPVRTDTTTALAQALSPPEPPTNIPATATTGTTSSAIGPSSEQLASAPNKEGMETGPMLQLTLLLTSGARHPFKLDSKYLARRNVEVQDNDPFNLSVYKLKELILREWREEWEQKPTNPSYIRLISFGRLLDDKSALKDNRFNPEQSNVIHMTIKPQDFADEDEGKGGKSSFAHQNDGTDGRSPGCRCLVM